MTRVRLVRWVGLTVLLFGVASHAAPGIPEFERSLASLGLAAEAEIRQVFELGFTQGRLQPEEAIRLLDALGRAPGSAPERQSLLLVIVGTLRDGLPASMLVSKACEGLARGVPVAAIEQGIALRARLEVGVRDLLFSKRVFSAPNEGPAASGVLPPARFDALVAEITDALADYLEGGGSPLDGYRLLDAVTIRLTRLSGTVLLPQDVELVLSRVGASDLTRVVQNALDQQGK